MRSDLAREIRYSLIDIPSLLDALGMRARRDGSGFKISCPAHEERTPSCSVRIGADGTIACRCHGCGWSGDALGLVAIASGLDVRRDFRAVLRLAAQHAHRFDLLDGGDARTSAASFGPRVPAKPPPPTINRDTYHAIATHLLEVCDLRSAQPVASYLDRRGVYADAEAVGVRGLPEDQRALVAALCEAFPREELVLSGLLRADRDALEFGNTHHVLIPWRDRDGHISAIQRRRLDERRPKYLFPPRLSPREPFGADLIDEALAFSPDAEVVVTEGALDTLARRKLARLLGERSVVIGIPSASMCSSSWSTYFEHRNVVIAFDSDDAGDDAASRFASGVCADARTVTRERPVDAKDCNEVLLMELVA